MMQISRANMRNAWSILSIPLSVVVALVVMGCAAGDPETSATATPGPIASATGQTSETPVAVEPEVEATMNADVYIMGVDGSGLRRLTDHAGDDLFAGWSPDGTEVLFVSSRDGNSEVYAVRADGSDLRRITDQSAQDWSPVWSPDGERIAFESLTDSAQYIRDIWIMKRDGSEKRRLTDGTRDSTFPVWSPAGTQILYVAYIGGESDIYIVDVDGANGRRLTKHPASDEWPSWSPDGQQIAFASHRDGNWEIYTIKVDGSEQTRATRTAGDEAYPTWSPDGRNIAFTSNHQSDHPDLYDLYVMDADGGNVKRLTDSSLVQFPEWAPDSTRIAFSMWDEMRSIAIVALSSGEVWRVPNQPSGDVISIDWSPDGQMLGFTAAQPALGPEALSGAIYRFPKGVSVTYPDGWSVEAYGAPGGPGSAWFRPDAGQVAAIGVEVCDRPASDRGTANPYTWQPNEGGYQVQWAQPVVAGDMEGLLFVWGARLGGEWQGMPVLMAVYYSESAALDIRLTTEFTVNALELAGTAGLTETVASQFDFFHLMAESIHIAP